jgi:type IV secretory pathway TraG/TraD family ATPase VirD4
MKLKFRADAKDILIFIIFLILLLYFVALGILNLASFAADATFHGLNPFPAFSSEYITVTFLMYFLALIMIMTSVSSYFFERDKGFGVSTSKKEPKGYARWAEEKEMKKILPRVKVTDETVDHAGVVLMNNGKELWVDDSENHSLVIGATGSGKTTLVVLPLVKVLAKKGESMIITDPKGEIYRNNSEMLKEKGYNIIVLNFRDPEQGSAWNPLMLPYQLYKSGNKDKAIELLDDLAINILYDEKGQSQDPFWEKTSADYFVGLALALFEDAKEEEINLNSINLMSTVGEERFRSSNYLKEYFSEKDPSSPMYVNVASALLAPSETKGSILSVFKQKIKLFSSREKISEMLSHSDIDMHSIGRQKTAVFIVVQDEKKTYHPLVTTFIKQCYESLIDVAQENGGKLKYRTNFILDEFANMPPLKDVTTMITAARSRLIRMNLIIQNFAQLYQVYGKENGETIKGNCGNIIYLISTELSALEELSKLAGEVKSKEKDKTSSTPLVTVSDLQRLKQGEVIIFRLRGWPLKTKLQFDYKMDWGKKYPQANFIVRETSKVQIFDLKSLVEERSKEKMNALFQNNTTPKFSPVSSEGSSSNIDIDEMVKRIDARIAELEEEERKEQEKLDKKEEKKKEIKEEIKVIEEIEESPIIKVEEPIIEPSIISEVLEEEIIGTPTAHITNPSLKEEVKKDQKVIEDNYDALTDDQFFDDFFSDDDEE